MPSLDIFAGQMAVVTEATAVLVLFMGVHVIRTEYGVTKRGMYGVLCTSWKNDYSGSPIWCDKKGNIWVFVYIVEK